MAMNITPKALRRLRSVLRACPHGAFFVLVIYVFAGTTAARDRSHPSQVENQKPRELQPENVVGPTLEALGLLNRGIRERDLGEMEQARAQLKRAVDLVETVRPTLRPEGRPSYFTSKQPLYDAYIDVLLSLHEKERTAGHHVAAFDASQDARRRPLLDTLSEARADLRADADHMLLARERELQVRVNAAADRAMALPDHATAPTPNGLDEEVLAEVLVEYRAARRAIRTSSPSYRLMRPLEPLHSAAVQRLLDSETVLLEYWIGERRSVAWIVTRESVDAITLAPKTEIHALARQAYEELSTPRRARHTPATAVVLLSDAIVAPVSKHLNRQKVLVVADGVLEGVPFGALVLPAASDGQRRLLTEAYELTYVPSATAAAALGGASWPRPPRAGTVAVFADPVFTPDDPRVTSPRGKRPAVAKTTPPYVRSIERSAQDLGVMPSGAQLPRLPFARAEAESILRLVPADGAFNAVGFAANLATLTSTDLSRFRIVHFATHGLIHPLHPLLSGIVMSLVDRDGRRQNGFLRLHDIYNLRLPVELVVLSACQTGVAEPSEIHGAVDMTHGFMAAGARRVLVSLWKIDDEATAELMKYFYEHLLGRENVSPASALRAAQLALRRNPRWSAPYFWAGFVLHGDWR
jgi:CHAT domain-containing protein